MSGTVGTHEPRAVHRETHRKRLDCHVVHHLVVGALQEGRIDHGERTEALRGQTRRKGHSVLFGDAHIETAFGKARGEEVETRAGGHGCRECNDLFVALGLRHQCLGENLGVGRRAGHTFLLFPRHDVELRNAVIFVRGGFGRCVALALLRHHMDQDGAIVDVADVLEHRNEVVEIMPVDRTDVEESEFLEKRPAHPEAAGILFRPLGRNPKKARQLGRHLLEEITKAAIGATGDKARQIGAHGAHRRRNRHVVVVQDNDQPGAHSAGIIHRLIGHARAHRAVADNSDNIVLLSGQIARRRKTEASRDRGRGMRRAKRVVDALCALGEAGKSATLAQRSHARAPAGENLVWIGLMADVPNQLVARRIEDAVQRDREFDDPKAGSQMTACDRHHVNSFLSQLIRQLLELIACERA